MKRGEEMSRIRACAVSGRRRNFWLAVGARAQSKEFERGVSAVQGRGRKNSKGDAIRNSGTSSSVGWLRDVVTDHPLIAISAAITSQSFRSTRGPLVGCVVRVSVQVTAWYADPVGAHSGYQVLASNGRLEADLLDQLGEQLAGKTQPASPEFPAVAAQERSAKNSNTAEPTISAPVPRIPETSGGFSSSLAQGLAEQEKAAQTGQKKMPDRDSSSLQAEADSLEEILRNQAHPEEPSGGKEVWDTSGRDGEFNCKDFVPGQRSR